MTKEEQMKSLGREGKLLMGFCPDCGESYPRAALDEPPSHTCLKTPPLDVLGNS